MYARSEAPSAQRLSDASIEATLRLVSVDEPGELGERLMELGLTPGVTLRILRRGAFGDPLQLLVRGYVLSIRKQQARAIRVVPLG